MGCHRRRDRGLRSWPGRGGRNEGGGWLWLGGADWVKGGCREVRKQLAAMVVEGKGLDDVHFVQVTEVSSLGKGDEGGVGDASVQELFMEEDAKLRRLMPGGVVRHEGGVGTPNPIMPTGKLEGAGGGGCWGRRWGIAHDGVRLLHATREAK